MSKSATLLTNGAKMLKEGENAKGKKWKLWGVLDEYDEVFGTWFNDGSMAREINDAAGSEIELEYEEDGDFKTIKSVGSPAGTSEAAQPGDDGHRDPGDVSGLSRSASTSLPETAWLCAAQMAKSDLGFDAAKNLADRILVDLKLKHGIDPDEDIPF